MSWLRWAVRILAPLLLADLLLRRLPHAHAGIPPHERRLHVLAVSLILRPGDLLLCKGASIDSCSVAAWSCSPFTHIAIVGPDLYVYDMTPVEHERRMTLPQYVAEYEGHCVLRRARTPQKEWNMPPPCEFRTSMLPLLGATLSETPLASAVSLLRSLYSPSHAFCSEYVCTALALPEPQVSHPMNFAPGGKYGGNYEGMYLIYG